MADSRLQHENALLVGQKRVLEMVATAAPLADTLTELTRFIEAQEEGLRCGILIVADDGAHFRRGSGPNLPESYHCALDGVPITPPYLGPCGQAAHQGIAVVVPDIAGDARWADAWRDLVLSCGLGACRSTPVQTSDNRVLASFAMYYDRPRDPHPAHPQLIEIATHLAGIALERERAEQRRMLLLNELNHRVKNTLATVQSIAAQTLRSTESDIRSRKAFEARLIGLASAHNLLTQDTWQGASLRDLLLQALEPYCPREHGRCAVEGPDLRLRPKTAIALSMAFHELATNAVKYGALSRPAGRIRVAWDVAQAPEGKRLRLRWTEAGGPPVVKPHRTGFGSRLIERGLAHELNGNARIAYEPGGVVCTIDISVAPEGN